MALVNPPRWTDGELEQERRRAIELFREERLTEPVGRYLQAFDDYAASVDRLMRESQDLRSLRDVAQSVLTDADLLEAFRYLAGPPVSTDDLMELAETNLTASRLRDDADATQRVIETILAMLDSRRFTWVAEGRQPSDEERSAAAMASASLMASQRVRTNRANEAKTGQEEAVRNHLAVSGLTEVETREVSTPADAPGRGEFCAECSVAGRKADVVVGLHDGRVMPIECKVSNSSTNSVKRLNNDAAAKAAEWVRAFGHQGIVPTAVLSGVFKTHNLVQAQESGLTIFWAHGLQPLTDFVAATSDP
ncbi:XamI family restriction endonuclease [Candidatus Poriferisodalis sp.]|uniref:XamI family restriction endonuclease n=1 Tax=Candidatus Poriferisodalis sp. TaxID=3101277 RepID=UPI003B5A62E0